MQWQFYSSNAERGNTPSSLSRHNRLYQSACQEVSWVKENYTHRQDMLRSVSLIWILSEMQRAAFSAIEFVGVFVRVSVHMRACAYACVSVCLCACVCVYVRPFEGFTDDTPHEIGWR